jgi:dipeptidyl aminopeptidase/acylaminoacyl peptidase
MVAVVMADEIPVEDFFRNSEYSALQLSPSGKYMATLAPIHGHRNLVVMETDGLKNPKQLTGISDQDILGYSWVSDDVIVFTMDDDGREDFGLYSVNRTTKKPKFKPLIEPEFKRDGLKFATIVSLLPDDPDHIIVQWNKRKVAYVGLYKLNVHNGQTEPLTEKINDVNGWLVDHQGVPRVAMVVKGLEAKLLYRSKEDEEFRALWEGGYLDEGITPLAFDFDNKMMYVASNIGRDRSAIYRFNPETNELGDMLFEHDKVDVFGLIMSRAQRKLLGVTYFDDYPQWHFFDKTEAEIYESLQAAFPGMTVDIVSNTDDEKLNVLLVSSDRDPGSYYLYDRETGAARFLLAPRQWIDPEQMSRMEPISFTARDGLEIPGYLTLPKDRKMDEAVPLIVNPHGGPFGVRDFWGYNAEHQFFANRGYAAVQVNFRGSGGYGRQFQQAGYGQWGKDMQNDISDAVKYLIDEGIADPERICIYGGSYGGYATMAGLTFTPELYRCGINYVGVTDVALLFSSMPKHWEPLREVMKIQIGDPENKEWMDAISPLAHVDKIDDPLMIVHGRQDPRVVMKHADRLRRELKKAKKPFEWFVKANEGHGFRKEDNRLELYRKVDEFLAKNL